MALKAKEHDNGGGGGFRQPPLDPGTYPGRLVQVISLGLQKQRAYQGQEKDPKHMIYTTYELADEFIVNEEGEEQEDKPRWVSEDFPIYGLGADRATSTARYYALDPKEELDGDWAQLIGRPVNIVIAQNRAKKDPEKIYNNITSISTMREKDAAKVPELKNDPKVFDIDEPDMEVFFSLPQWLQDRIKENLEYEGSDLEKLVEQGNQGEKKPEKKEKKPAKAEPEETQDEEDNEDEDW